MDSKKHWNFNQISNLIFGLPDTSFLLEGRWGVERETQRTTAGGEMAVTNHPEVFGDKLENPEITTDFAESQLEIVTKPYRSVAEVFGQLKKIHKTVDDGVPNDEFLWPLSMPPILPDDERAIPIAKFNQSESGQKKYIYRKGLAHRYGKKRQMLSGIHYNFSFGDSLIDFFYHQYGGGMDRKSFQNEIYFATARNFMKYRWLLIYLFGASPVYDESYESALDKELDIISNQCHNLRDRLKTYQKNAISIRVSRFGYSNEVEHQQHISYNQLSEYLYDIRKLLNTTHNKYERLGIYQNGEQIQLNSNILQNEGEFYSPLRFKPRKKCESQLKGLEEEGVCYLEIRILDNNPFEKVGISLNQLHFMQIFMLFCLFEDNRFMTEEELRLANENHHITALTGRKPNVKLYQYDGSEVLLTDWAEEVFAKLNKIAIAVDHTSGNNTYHRVIKEEWAKVTNPNLILSEKMLTEMEKHKESYLEFGMRLAKTYKERES